PTTLSMFCTASPRTSPSPSFPSTTLFRSPADVARSSHNETQKRRLGERRLRMLETGAFPIAGAPIPPRRGAPRVGDGVVKLDEAGVVQWISPNAISAFHRFGIEGDIVGVTLAELSTEVLQSR